ncbi:MAG: AmmeMemoRadiSam system radical SAM enzyme [Verrucomicrobia bacterium]|nr:AmmeMemoRadiSam system radical SAM enzyme [Verrucomicrobiota bacterium]
MDKTTPNALMTRRQALACGAAGVAGLTLVSQAGWLERLLKLGDSEMPADVFKGDAPNNELWALWRERGWVKEVYHYLKLGRNVQCKTCPNNCLLAPGDRSHCRNKVNINGTLYTMAYGNPCTFHVDPVEKKPLFHFLPATPTFSLATSGCVFRCLNCQNWEISQKKPEETKNPRGPAFRLHPPMPSELSLEEISRLSLFPDDVVAVAHALNCPSISYTYSEPTAYYEYAYDTCKLAREHRLKNIIVTCGSIEDRPLRDLAQFVDAAHVDLKGFDESIYQKLNSGRLQPVLDRLKTYHELGVWFEVINLVVPTYTDDLEVIKRMCGWLVENLGPDRPLHFSRFSPQHKLEHLPPTPVDILLRARAAARALGLRYVYIGNVREVPDAGTTFCPNCRGAVVERDVFSVTAYHIAAGKCSFCGTPIAGVWSA